jgi:hypothetical protein
MIKPEPPTFKDDNERIELENYILGELKKRRKSDDELTWELCQKANWNWATSQIFIESVREKYSSELVKHSSRFFLYFYAVLALLGLIVFISSLDRGEEASRINSCLEITLSAELQKVMGTDKVSQCYALAATDFFNNLVTGGYQSLLILVGTIGLLIFILSTIGLIVTLVRSRRAVGDQTQRIKYFS